MSLLYDPTRLSQSVASHGLSDASFHLSDAARAAYTAVQASAQEGKVGFLLLDMLEGLCGEVETLVAQLQGTYRQVVLVGIGGSDLGARAVYQALQTSANPDIQFLCTGNTTDPDAVAETLAAFVPEEALLIFISKSGVTLEVTSVFMLLLEAMRAAIGTEAAAKRVIAITDPEGGALRRLAGEQGWYTAPVPSQIGGRFSVFTPVGLLPLALVGIPVRELLAGAVAYAHADLAGASESQALLAAQHQVEHYWQGQPNTILMTYVAGLGETTAWFKQLWAESLGKKLTRSGEVRPVGPLPLAAVGPTDQHSQLQRWVEGPADCVTTFVCVQNPATDYRVPDAFPGDGDVAYMVGHSLHEIRTIQMNATADALAAAGKPSAVLQLDRVSAHALGELLMHCMLMTAYAAELLDINAYDQPGVEYGKVLAKERLHQISQS